MGDGTKENPYTREDVLRLIKENSGKTEGLDFSGKVFEEGINLSGQYLCGIILKDTELIRAKFDGSDLDDAVMQRANLQYATFNPLDSKHCRLAKADFSGAYLKNTEFQKADLSGAQFREVPCRDTPPKLMRTNLEETDFRNSNLFGTIFDAGCKLYKTKLEGAYIEASSLLDARLGDADWGSFIIGEEKKDSHNYNLDIAEHRYRQLKVWYIQSGYSDTAAKFYYREKEAHRKSLKLFSKSWNHRIASQFSYWVFGHGEGWKRILFWIAGFVLAFALLYYKIGTLTPNTFLDSLYYSAASFVALGYGAWVEESIGWVKGLGVTETFLGFFMMTLLLVTFVRKWAR